MRSSKLKVTIYVLLAIVLGLALLAGGAAAWFHWAARSAMPTLDGTMTAHGLSAAVTVVRILPAAAGFCGGRLDLRICRGKRCIFC